MLKRVFIIGTMGSGKSTLAREIGRRISTKVYSLDNFYWTKKYTYKRNEKSREVLVGRLLKRDKWVVEGVFSTWVGQIAKDSDLVIWLDMSKLFVSKNILKRYLTNKLKGIEKERGGFSDIWKTLVHARRYKKGEHKNSYKGHKEMLEKSKARHIRITNKKQLNKFLKGLK